MRAFALVLSLLFSLFLCTPADAQREIPTGSSSRGKISQDGISGMTGNRNNHSDMPSDSTGTQADTSATKGLVYHTEIPDSVLRRKVYKFHYNPLSTKIDELWNPSLDPTGMQFSEPLDAFNGNYYLSTGVIGHPHYAIFPTLPASLDPTLQPDEYAYLAKRPANIWLYQTLTPYTLLSYNSSLRKDYMLQVAHTQNILPGWNVAFDYRLICPDGIFANSDAKNHYLDVTTNYFSSDSRLQAVVGFIWNDFNVGENGGLSNDSIFIQQSITNPSGFPVNDYNSHAKHSRKNIFGRVSYNLVRQFDYCRKRDTLVLRQDTITPDSIVTRLDTVQLTDTIRVGKPRILNAGILGLEIDFDHRKRTLADTTLFASERLSVYWTNDAYPDHRWHNPLKLTLGLRQRLCRYDINSVNIQNVAWADPFGHIELSLNRLTLAAEGERSSVQDNVGKLHVTEADYRIAAMASLRLDSAGATLLSLSATGLSMMPNMRMRHDATGALKPLKRTHFELHLSHNPSSASDRTMPLFDFSLQATHMDHHTWYDSTLAVVEGTTPLWMLQAALTVRLHWRWIHLDMQQLLQRSSDNSQLAVPLWASKNSLYADLTFFRGALRMQLGTDIRYHTAFQSDSYDAGTGLFYHQMSTSVGNYIWADVFLNIQVKRATIYVKAGHINALWESHPSYFLLPHYPGQNFGLFWGIRWHFFD